MNLGGPNVSKYYTAPCIVLTLGSKWVFFPLHPIPALENKGTGEEVKHCPPVACGNTPAPYMSVTLTKADECLERAGTPLAPESAYRRPDFRG